MYQFRFTATDDADWAQAIEIIDADTNLPMDISAADFALEVSDCGSSVLSADTDTATITKPDNNTIQWRFTVAQMGGLCPGRTYDVGLTMTTLTGTTQLGVGSLVLVDGGF
jgi:hypothetical protein